MGKSITLQEATGRFGALVTTDIGVSEAIQEAVDRIYEMGRYPGTTEEIELVTEDFIYDPTLNCHYLFFEEARYDGAIGFRATPRGWSIVDHTALYKDGMNMGDQEFVDLGTVDRVMPDNSVVSSRKYRCPLDWDLNSGPYYALLKLEAPVLDIETVIPIQSIGALKCAIQAVCHEYTGNDQGAQLKWQEFDGFMKLSERQTHGRKRWTLGMDCSLMRRPRSFY